jgi:hypothetical protein
MAEDAGKKICGLVMPISAIDGLAESHWTEVLVILSDAIDKAGFTPNLVSNADDIGIIQKRIIQNLYDNPIVVCDVSGKNPNVMFELGIRLAFDKPTIIVKDDKTSYSFDTAPIEHLSYPRDIRYSQIMEFKDKLIEKIKGTYAKATTDPGYTTFLKNFGEFTVAKLDKKEISGQEFILEELKAMRLSIQRLEGRAMRPVRPPRPPSPSESEEVRYRLRKLSSDTKGEITSFLDQEFIVDDFHWSEDKDGTVLSVTISGHDEAYKEGLTKKIAEIKAAGLKT